MQKTSQDYCCIRCVIMVCLKRILMFSRISNDETLNFQSELVFTVRTFGRRNLVFVIDRGASLAVKINSYFQNTRMYSVGAVLSLCTRRVWRYIHLPATFDLSYFFTNIILRFCQFEILCLHIIFLLLIIYINK